MTDGCQGCAHRSWADLRCPPAPLLPTPEHTHAHTDTHQHPNTISHPPAPAHLRTHMHRHTHIRAPSRAPHKQPSQRDGCSYVCTPVHECTSSLHSVTAALTFAHQYTSAAVAKLSFSCTSLVHPLAGVSIWMDNDSLADGCTAQAMTTTTCSPSMPSGPIGSGSWGR